MNNTIYRMATEETIIIAIILIIVVISTYYMYKSFINRVQDNGDERDTSVQELTRNR